MSTLVDVLAAHVPYVGDHGVGACSCGQRGFNRDEDRNLLKDGEDERAWAEHVEAALRQAVGQPPPTDPHVVSRTESGYEILGLWGRPGVTVHKPFTDDGVTYCGWAGDHGIHEGCGEVWPCATVRARRMGEQGELPIGSEACPDCKANKHPVCTGDSWDKARDVPVRCPCAVNGHRS